MTRAMLMTVLARFDGQDTTGGAVWYEKAMTWAKENGISDGSNPDGSITREQPCHDAVALRGQSLRGRLPVLLRGQRQRQRLRHRGPCAGLWARV